MCSPLRMTSKISDATFPFQIELSNYFSVLTSNHSFNSVPYSSAILAYLFYFINSILVILIPFLECSFSDPCLADK